MVWSREPWPGDPTPAAGLRVRLVRCPRFWCHDAWRPWVLSYKTGPTYCGSCGSQHAEQYFSYPEDACACGETFSLNYPPRFCGACGERIPPMEPALQRNLAPRSSMAFADYNQKPPP